MQSKSCGTCTRPASRHPPERAVPLPRRPAAGRGITLQYYQDARPPARTDAWEGRARAGPKGRARIEGWAAPIPERPTAEDNTEEIGRIVPPEAAVAVTQAAAADAARAAAEAAAPEAGQPSTELDLADTQPDIAPVAPAPGPENDEPSDPTESDE